MSETIADNTATDTTDATDTTAVTQEPQGTPETDWKAEARKWESRAKADHELANKWREYETSQKSEHEKLADALAQAKAEASEASSKLLKYEVASQKGIPADALDLLVGSNREDLETAADKLLSLIANQSQPKSPRPDENQGKPAPSGVGQLTREDLKGMSQKEILEAKAAGRLDDILGKN